MAAVIEYLRRLMMDCFITPIRLRGRRISRYHTAVHPLFSNRENAPYKYAIQLAFHHLRLDSSNTMEEKIEAIATIGHLCWTGGAETAEFTGKKYLFTLSFMLKDVETPDALKLQIIKSLSEICCGVKQNQDTARENMLIPTIIEFMTNLQDEDEARKWCLHTLFYLLCNNEENQKQALENPHFGVCVLRGLCDNWDDWDHNEARELETMTTVIYAKPPLTTSASHQQSSHRLSSHRLSSYQLC